MSILDILVKQGLIETKDLSSIKEKTQSSVQELEDTLLSLGISEEDILRAKSEYYAVPVKKIDASLITSKVLDYIPEEAAVYYQFVPIGLVDGVLEVGVMDTDNISARDALNFISSKINIVLIQFLVFLSLLIILFFVIYRLQKMEHGLRLPGCGNEFC